MERAAADQSQRQIARETGTPRVTVQRVLAVMQCEVNELRQFQRDAFMMGWQMLYLDTLGEFYEGPRRER
jgi:DNA-binding IclR family transcriptional regulator